jgi:hypothetical protein
VQIGLPAPRDLNLGFEEQIQFASKRTFCTARPFRHRLDAAKRFGAPRNNQACVAKFSLA